jgi:hypothetical protein
MQKPFTEAYFVNLLERASAEYEFVFHGDPDNEKYVIIWRHDVDVSPHRALALAHLEQSKGVRATYFVQLSSVFYGMFESANIRIFREIYSLGHRLGLHFDPCLYDTHDHALIEEKLSFERAVIATLLEQPIPVFSLHNPTLVKDRFRGDEYAGMINASGDHFRTHFHYCSDSNGVWQYEDLYTLLKERRYARLHVLTHPVWWQRNAMLPRERIARSVRGRAEAVLQLYDELLEQNQRPNIRR